MRMCLEEYMRSRFFTLSHPRGCESASSLERTMTDLGTVTKHASFSMITSILLGQEEVTCIVQMTAPSPLLSPYLVTVRMKWNAFLESPRMNFSLHSINSVTHFLRIEQYRCGLCTTTRGTSLWRAGKGRGRTVRSRQNEMSKQLAQKIASATNKELRPEHFWERGSGTINGWNHAKT